ncbi:MAG: class I SAM-dependent methyltransferase [Chloroflexi bacterium]|nr:class I SAM-dependent methyltransferase [Chloroflexota bacterium]
MNESQYAEFGKGRFDTVSGSKLAQIKDDAGKSILDVGCGPGAYLKELAILGYEIAGVDRNKLFIEQALHVTDKVYLVDLDTEALSRFSDASFDTVLILDVLEHIQDDARLLQEAKRVCRRNVILTVPARIPNGMSEMHFVFSSYLDPSHLRYYSFSDMVNIMDKVAFDHYNIKSVMRFDPILYRIFPGYLRIALALINRVLLKISDPRLLTSIWYAVGWKS